MRTRFGFKVDQMLFGFFVVVLVISDVTMVTNQKKSIHGGNMERNNVNRKKTHSLEFGAFIIQQGLYHHWV